MLFEVLIGPNGKIPIVIRDDDTNFFTTKNMLESIYSKAWSKGFKVSLSVVPFQRGINDILVPPVMRKNGKHYSVADNKALVGYLLDKISSGQIEILQHGLSHDYSDQIHGEFGGKSDRKNDIEHGKKILNRALGVEPKFFVPPGEDISGNNLKNVTEAGLIPFYRRTLFDGFMRGKYLPNFLKEYAIKAYRGRYAKAAMDKNKNFGLQLIRPACLNLENNAITWSVPTIMSLKKVASMNSLLKLMKQIMDTSIRKRSPICIINHYHIYFYDWDSSVIRPDPYNAWHKVTEFLNSISYCSWKVTLSELYERRLKIHGVRIAKTGSKITIASTECIENFSIRTNRVPESNSSILKDEENPSITTIKQLGPQNQAVFYV